MSRERRNVEFPFWKIAGIFALLAFPFMVFAAGALYVLFCVVDQGNYIFVVPLLAVAVICVGIPLTTFSAVTITWFLFWVANEDAYG
jgi:hypothetical protein